MLRRALCYPAISSHSLNIFHPFNRTIYTHPLALTVELSSQHITHIRTCSSCIEFTLILGHIIDYDLYGLPLYTNWIRCGRSSMFWRLSQTVKHLSYIILQITEGPNEVPSGHIWRCRQAISFVVLFVLYNQCDSQSVYYYLNRFSLRLPAPLASTGCAVDVSVCVAHAIGVCPWCHQANRQFETYIQQKYKYIQVATCLRPTLDINNTETKSASYSHYSPHCPISPR